jgi:ApaG protein
MQDYAFTCTAVPLYLPDQSDPQQSIYSFAYTVTISNTGRVPAQLIARHWIMTDGNERTEQVKGLGVIGQQPLLKPGEAFEYNSWTRLATPTGVMHGSMFFVAVDGTRFDVEVTSGFCTDA